MVANQKAMKDVKAAQKPPKSDPISMGSVKIDEVKLSPGRDQQVGMPSGNDSKVNLKSSEKSCVSATKGTTKKADSAAKKVKNPDKLDKNISNLTLSQNRGKKSDISDSPDSKSDEARITKASRGKRHRHKPDSTNPVISNDDFITAVFGEIVGSDRPVTVSFPGNPAAVRKAAWFGRPYIAGKTQLLADSNNYTSFSTFKPDDDGKYRRQKKQFAALYAVMLDDIGVKVPEDRINLAPSWKIETSSGNFQIGYILENPITSAEEADRLVSAIINAGLTDPGASGPCSRIGRLPEGINGKRENDDGTPWQCRLTDWHPEHRYSVQQIVDGLQIELKESAQQRSSQGRKSNAGHDPHLDDVYVPRADENPAVSALKAAGLYKQPLGGGKHDITCPWLHEHTDQVDSGTCYFEPDESYPIGGFKCQHGHCADRRVGILYEFLGISKLEAKHRPMILIQPGELPRICDAVESELAKTKRHYQRGGVIVTITTDPSSKETVVKPLSLQSLTRALAGVVIWKRFDKRSSGWVVSDPPERHVRVLHDSTHYPHLPVLNGIARQPYLRPNGTLMLDADYDVETGMFGVFHASKFNVSDAPTREDALEALNELSELLSEFEFKTDYDHAAALAGILTAVVRPALPLAPMFHVNAPNIGSGKSYLCELLTTFATPQTSTPHTFPSDDEECRKLLLAELLTAPAVVEFDNLTSDLIPHKTLCTTLTSEFISGRILGQSKTAEVGTRSLFLSSGNNTEPVRDMTRRTVTINLDPKCETPAARNFLKQPVLVVRAERERFVSLVLTIVRAWICAGSPKTECRTIASFKCWSDWCRQPLLWLGLPDPARCIFESIQDDPDRERLGSLLLVWHKIFRERPVMIRDVISVNGNAALHDVLVDIAKDRDGSIDRQKLGWWIKKHAGRVVDGLRFEKDEATRNAGKWRVVTVKPNKEDVSKDSKKPPKEKKKSQQ